MSKNNKFKKALLNIFGASLMFLNNTALATKYAKITWIGLKGAGKTTLHKSITGEIEEVGNELETKNITSQEVLFKFESEDVICYFWDLPGTEDDVESLLKDFYEDSNVAIVMINANHIRDSRSMLFNNQAYTFQYIRKILNTCPNCKIVFGVIKLKNEKDVLFKNEVINYIENVLCKGLLKSRVAGWVELPDLDVINSQNGRDVCKVKMLELAKKAIEMYGIDKLPETSKNLHGRFEWFYETKKGDDWVDEYDGETCAGNNKYKKVNRPKDLIVNKRLILKKW